MEQKVGYYIKLINDKIKTKADYDLKSNNLTLSQSRVLSFIHQHGGETTQKEIEDNLKVAHPTVVGLVKRMEKHGFLISFFDPNNGRNKIVKLTPKAEVIGNNMAQVIDGQEDKILKGLSEEERKQFLYYLVEIYKNIS